MTTRRGLVVFLVFLLVGSLLAGWGMENTAGASDGWQQAVGRYGAGLADKGMLHAGMASRSGQGAGEGTCCRRRFCIDKIPMPEGQVWDWGGWIRMEFISGFTRESYYPSPDAPELAWSSTPKNLSDCPLRCEETPCGNTEYMFRGELSVSNQTDFIAEDWEEGYEPGSAHLAGGGNIVGDWTLHVQLLDPHHGNVLAERSVSWQGTVDDMIVQRVWYERPQDFAPWSTLKHPLREWASTFLEKELDDFLHDYERLPEQAQIEPEEKEVMKGEKMTIRLTDIVDGEGRASQPWWRIFVKVEQGEILNAPETQGEYSVFRVGEEGVEIEYQAPEECPEDRTETITVLNTCNMREDINGTPEQEIASGAFEIVCPKFEIEYDHQGASGFFGWDIVTTGRIPVSVRIDEDGYYRLEGEGTVDIASTLAEDIWVRSGGTTLSEVEWSADKPARGTVNVIVDGDLVDVGGDVYELYITLKESWYATWNTPTMEMEITVLGQTQTHSQPWAVDPIDVEVDLVFPAEDGYSNHISIDLGFFVAGQSTWTLHVLEE